MFFVLSKTVAIFLLPSNLLFLLMGLGAVLMLMRWRRLGGWILAAGFVPLALVVLMPAGSYLLHGLESRFPRWDPSRGAPDGVIVLGGAIIPILSHIRGETVVGGDAGRVIAMADLARKYPAARIVYTGGDASLTPTGLTETKFVYPLLDQLGVPRERVLLESRSRNTAENAAFTKELVKPKPGERWLLVTTAWHMPRAVGCFRRVGFPVEAYPVGWRTGTRVGFAIALDVSSRLGRLDLAVHEWMGIIAYWLTGRTNELLPSP